MMISRKKYEPPMKSLCLCGSGKKFKNCCYGNHHTMTDRSSEKLIDIINDNDKKKALEQTREYITWYTICHKTNTEPLLLSKNHEGEFLLDVDIKALSDLLGLLFECYKKSRKTHEFETACERLRGNIRDPRWQRKVTYYQILSKIDGNWSPIIGEKEVKKFEPICEEEDTEIIKLYFHFMGDKLPFKKRVELLENLVSMLSDEGEKLQYKMAIAANYLYVHDNESAENIISKAKDDFLYKQESSIHTQFIYAKCLSTLADLKQNGKLKKEAYYLFVEILDNSELTDVGSSKILQEMANCLFHLSEFDASIKTYQLAYKLSSDEIIKVFMSLSMIDKSDKLSLDVLSSVDSSRLDNYGLFAYAINYSCAATKFQDKQAIEKSLELLKSVICDEPTFEKRRLETICKLNDLLTTGQFSKKQHMYDFFKNLSKYIIVQPNIGGIGLDFNKIFENKK